MREDTSTQRAFSPALIIGAVVAVIALSSIGVVIVQNMSNNGPVDVVILKSETSSFKEKPAQEISDDDAGSSSSVMNMLDDLTENKDDIEVLSLKTETPEMPEIQLPKAEEETSSASQETSELQETEEDNVNEVVSVEQDEDSNKPVKRPLTPLVSKNTAGSGPSMMVQLAAFRDQQKAEEVAALLTEKHKSRLQGLGLGIMPIETNNSGVFWRVITEALPSEDARNLCDELKRAGQDCIFRKVATQ